MSVCSSSLAKEKKIDRLERMHVSFPLKGSFFGSSFGNYGVVAKQLMDMVRLYSLHTLT